MGDSFESPFFAPCKVRKVFTLSVGKSYEYIFIKSTKFDLRLVNINSYFGLGKKTVKIKENKSATKSLSSDFFKI